MMQWSENQERRPRREAGLLLRMWASRLHRPGPAPGPQYEVVRADARRFVIAPGHEFLAAEDVVEERAGYVVVQKHEDVRALVERMDLRRGDAGHDS